MAKVTLTKEQINRLNALKISSKSEEDARKGLIAVLKDNDVDGMDDEDMDTLLDLAESLMPAKGETTEDNDDASEEAELAKEVEADAEEVDPEEEDAAPTGGDEFDAMDRTALKKYIKENGLDVKVYKSQSDDDIRTNIRAALTSAPAEAEEKTAKKETVAQKPVAAKKPAEGSAEKPATKKSAEKATKAPTSKRGVKLDPQNNPDDLKVLTDAFSSIFPEEEFRYDPVKSAGVTIKHKGQNSSRALVLIENCSRQIDGSIKCNLYFLTLTKNLEVLDNADIAYEKCWSGAPFIKGTTVDEAVEMISSVKDSLTAQVKKIDKRLGENRAKMEQGLEKKAASSKPAPETAEKKASAAKKTVKK